MKKTVVIKLGGSSLQDPLTLKALAQTARSYQERERDVVVVHGGGPAINAELSKRGITWTFLNGQRRTTAKMISVIEEVLAGSVNTQIVESLQANGLQAKGLCGAKNRILFCTQLSRELGKVGAVQTVNATSIDQIFKSAESSIPVIAPLGFGMRATKYNINADWAATRIAMALKAEELIFLTDQKGILNGEGQLVRRAEPELIQKMIHQGVISGGMCTKVLAMIAALDAGVGQVRVLKAADASRLHARTRLGTVLVPNRSTQTQRREDTYVSAS